MQSVAVGTGRRVRVAGKQAFAVGTLHIVSVVMTAAAHLHRFGFIILQRNQFMNIRMTVGTGDVIVGVDGLGKLTRLFLMAETTFYRLHRDFAIGMFV